MNAILYNSDTSSTDTEEVFEEAKQIIENNSDTTFKEPKKKHTKAIVITICIIVFLLIIGALSTIFALLNINSDKIISGISILGIDVSGLTQDEANSKIAENLNSRLETNLVFNHNGTLYNVLPSQLECSYDISRAVGEAYSYGRNGNIFKNNFDILNTLINKVDINIDFSYNNDLYESVVSQMNANFEDGIKESSYTIDGNNLIIISGKAGNVIKSDEFKDLIVDKLTAIDYNTDSIEVPVEEAEPAPIDIDKIHSEIYKEAKDAYYTTDPYAVYPSSNGLDFNISVDEAKQMVATPQDTYTIPLKTLYPSVTTNEIGREAFPDLLATYSTSYASSNANRSTNIALAASKINGTVLMPGEEFSFNGTVGKRTAANGFKTATVYSNGQVTTDYGGGICQVSSTLYNSVLRANLEITNRTNHTFTVGYVPIGLDATVSWGSPDFKFKNSRNYPIKIVATTANKKLTISVYGLKEDVEYEVELVSYKTGTVPYSTVYTTDSSLGKGKTKVVQSGSNGATSVAYKILKLNGKEVSRTLLSKDTYSPHNQIIARGN
mgnify:FL=1